MTLPGTTTLTRRIALLALALAGTVLLLPAAARAQDDYLTRANSFYASISQAKRSDLVILPALAAMDAPPASVREPAAALLMPITSAQWPQIEEWAAAPAQRAAIEALAAATADEGPTTHMVFAQPYGYEGVPIELIMAELYTDLGDPPSLAAADLMYLRQLDKLWSLAHVEANRLIAAGKGSEAMEVMLDWLFFARQIVDRELAPEKVVGLRMMHAAFEHLRDIAYQDFQSPQRSLTTSGLVEVIRRLDERRSALDLSRILLPRADRIAVEQLLYRIYDQRSRKPDPATYSTVMARISSQDRPLRLFSEAAKWDAVRAQAADWHAIIDTLKNVANDFERRWGLAFRDPVLSFATDFERNVRGKQAYAPIAMRYDAYPGFFKTRQDLRVEAGGTRMALAMYAYFLQHNQLPRDITAVRPNFTPRVDPDPYSPDNRDYAFFVPIRDQPKGSRGEPAPPHEIRIFPGGVFAAAGLAQNFSVSLREDQFVIYSLGPDEARGWAKDATQSQEEYRQGDHLIWPPVASLLRQHLVQQGKLN